MEKIYILQFIFVPTDLLICMSCVLNFHDKLCFVWIKNKEQVPPQSLRSEECKA